MKLLYIDATNSGISGDMFLASLLNLIPIPNKILDDLKRLKEYLSGVLKLDINLRTKKISGILVNQIKIEVKENKNHRSPESLVNALNQFLDEKDYSDPAKVYANNVLNSLIQAEAEIHGKSFKDLHLHELSSVDTLIDILGVSKSLDLLGGFSNDFKIHCSKLPLGGGTVKTAHGILPIPAPATSKILERSNLVVSNGPIDEELVTPTGVALLTNLNPKIAPYEMKLKKLVYSTGQKEFGNFLNILRLFYGETKDTNSKGEHDLFQKYLEPITILETNVDDISGELIGNFIKNLEQEDILDVQIVPSITKKNRPGHIIKVLCRPDNKYILIKKMIDELGTLGVRFNTINRVCVDRKIEKKKIEINGKIYELKCKISSYISKNRKKIVNIKPEYEDLKNISKDSGYTIKEIKLLVLSKLNQISKE